MTAARATVLSVPRQPLTTLRLGGAMLLHRPGASLRGNMPLARRYRTPIPQSPGSPEFEAVLDQKRLPRADYGSITWLVDGPGFFPELDRLIDGARRSIDVQVFIFDNDSVGVRTAERLKLRSGEVPVRVLFDDLGTSVAHAVAPDTPGPKGFIPPADMGGFLEADSHIRARRTLNPWLVCDHTKLLVFDQQTAILGGMNIGQEYYSEWHDLMARVEGPIVQPLARMFNRAWRKNGPWGDLALLRKPERLTEAPQPVHGCVPMRILRTDPAEGRDEIHDALMLAIRGARQRIWIQTPYFCESNMVGAVAAAAARGVEVRIILPGKSDSPIMQAANLSASADLISAGARIYHYPGMTHMKVVICDGWATFGSANLDTLSMKINRELNLAFCDPDTLLRLERAVFAKDFKISKQITAADAGGLGNRLVRIVTDQL